MPSTRQLARPLLWSAAIVAMTAVVLLWMGRVPVCECGTVRLWHGVVFSAENSQHLSDWYSFTHIVHGFVFYGLLWLVGRRWPVGTRLVMATAIEGAWEILENTNMVIERYREVTIALDYYGDSVINSVSDIVMMLLGFVVAMRAPTRVSLALAIGLELFLLVAIRDNLTLNILMLVWPLDVVRDWQAAVSPLP